MEMKIVIALLLAAYLSLGAILGYAYDPRGRVIQVMEPR